MLTAVRLRTLLGMALLVVGLSTAPADAASVLCIAPAGAPSCASPFSGTVVVGEEFRVDLLVQDVDGLNNFLLDAFSNSFISFDPNILQVADISEGPFLTTNGADCEDPGNCTTFLFSSVDPAGRIDLLFGGFNGLDFEEEADGTGPLARITFTAIAIGHSPSPIRIEGDPASFFADASFNLLPAPDVRNGSVRVIVPEPGVLMLLSLGWLGALSRKTRY